MISPYLTGGCFECLGHMLDILHKDFWASRRLALDFNDVGEVFQAAQILEPEVAVQELYGET
jgi:hypothetical protein